MASSYNSVKYLTLDEVKKVIDSLGVFAESTLYTHSLALIINKSGEATFTSCGWKLLNEVGCSCPLSKLICNAAMKYTSFCGDDCKYFLFILREMFNVIYSRVDRNNELCMRREIINEICSLNRILPCVFKSIRNISGGCISDLDSFSFSKDLHNVVLTFMLSRFSLSVSKVLSSLICDFIQNICEVHSLKSVLNYVISHFDIFCCKILSPLSESQILKGFVFYTKYIPSDLNLENINFIIVWNLSMKMVEDVVWKIRDESFIKQLSPMHMYQIVFDYFKSQGIMMIFTPSSCNKDLKLLCEKSNIFLFDQLEVEEIKHMLSCIQLYPLEDLNESLESKHIGILSYAKPLSSNKMHFLHLMCMNSVRFLNAHHILLSAPCNAIWKEYYSECLNCFKMILQWLSPETNLCFRKKIINKVPKKNQIKDKQLSTCKESEDCDLCLELKRKFENETKIVAYLDAVKSNSDSGILLPPCSWELIFKTVLVKITEISILPCKVILQATHLAVEKSICKKVGAPFIAVKDIENACLDFIKKCNISKVRYLEPVVCKEIMIHDILDLILQLLKIDGVVSIK